MVEGIYFKNQIISHFYLNSINIFFIIQEDKQWNKNFNKEIINNFYTPTLLSFKKQSKINNNIINYNKAYLENIY